IFISNKFSHLIFHKILQQEPTVGHRANVAEWRQRRHFAAFALSCIAVKRTHLVRYVNPMIKSRKKHCKPTG
ncbi:hypothetical protein M1717_25025, partial [Salmonella enterica subsp. enterica serovar Pomona]|nr:hypothetical protein [Salmonella enterica subsp. enterica serovar Pomona]